jgi:hypothetical protein
VYSRACNAYVLPDTLAMGLIQGAKYEKLQSGLHDLENVSLDEQRRGERSLLSRLGLPVRIGLCFICVLTLLNLGFLLGDRLVGTTCARRISTAVAQENIIWSELRVPV